MTAPRGSSALQTASPPSPATRTPVVVTAAVLAALAGAGLTGGGAWLLLLGGSAYYAIVGVALLATAGMLMRGSPWSLSLYAAVVLGTLAWSLWETGLDWWPLAARGGLLVVFGVLIASPGVASRTRTRTAALPADPRARPSAAAHHGALLAALSVAMVVGAISWMNDPHQKSGVLAGVRTELPFDLNGVPQGEWHAYGRSGFGQRFSPLTEITPENVSRLDVAWTYRTGDMPGQPGDPVETTFEVTPLKIGNRLFLCTPHQDVIALDATTGAELWRYDPNIRDRLALQHLTCRGLAYARFIGVTAGPVAGPPPDVTKTADSPVENLPVAAAEAASVRRCGDRLFMPTADGRLIALDPATGAVCVDFGEGTGQVDLWRNMPNVRAGAYYSTSPPVVAGDLVIVGGTVLDNVSVNEQSGVIRAFSAATGRLVWNWDSGNPDETTPIDADRTYTPNSPNSWSVSSVDEGLGLVYVPLGNQPPDQWGGRRSDSVERFSSSIVALELETGRVRWVFQTVHHDLWDYDVPAQPTLVDLRIRGETVPALVQPTKQGDIFVLDRRNGAPLLPVEEVPAPQGAAEGDHTAPTQPVSALSLAPAPLTGADMWGVTMFDQLACRIQFRRLRYEGRFTPPTVGGSLINPGNFGVFNWGGVAVDPQRQIAFATPAYLVFVATLVPRADNETLYVQSGGPPKGSLPALNENFGAPFAAKLMPFTSVIGLPCQAPPWGYVAGVDLTTGDVIWMHKNGTVRDRAPVPLPIPLGVPSLGGPIVTAGGVAFLSGTIDYYLRAYDVTTGTELLEKRLPAGGQATPMTYLGEDGRQYVVVVAGGHGSLRTKVGDYVIAYALPRA